MPGTTLSSAGAYCRISARSAAAHTMPPQPPSSATFTRFGTMWGGASLSLVSTVTASAIGLRQPGVAGALGQALDAGPEHVDAAVRVHRDVRDAERAEHPRRLVDGGGDVVELEVEEDVVAEVDAAARWRRVPTR